MGARPRTRRTTELTYGLLTLFSALLELGVLIAALSSSSLAPLIWWMASFQLANLTCYILPRIPPVLAAASWGAGIAGMSLGFPAQVAVVAVAIFLMKLGLQWMRNSLRAEVRSVFMFKNLPRIIGFALAPLFGSVALVALSAIVSLLAFGRQESRARLWGIASTQAVRSKAETTPPYLVMLAHSAHFFSFGYAVMASFTDRFGIPRVGLGAAYLVGWIGYYVIERMPRAMPWHIALGHVVSAGAILILATTESAWIAMLAWAITGFGGGTIFLLPRLRPANPYRSSKMDLMDNAANLVGLAILFVALTAERPIVAYAAASALSLGSAGAALRLHRLTGSRNPAHRGLS